MVNASLAQLWGVGLLAAAVIAVVLGVYATRKIR